MLSNAEFAQLTGITQDTMPAEFADFALFALPFKGEDGQTYELWQVRQKTATELGRDVRAEQAAWEKEEESRRQENLARYVELADQGFYDDEANEESITDYAIYTRTR